MDARAIPLHNTLQLDTRLFLNCLDEVSDEVARWRPGAESNSIAYIALHLHDARHYLAKFLGVTEPDPFAAITSTAESIEDIDVYPSLSEMRTAWMEISLVLDQRFTQLTADFLDRPIPDDAPDFPVNDKSILGAVTFLLQHEGYHLGQLAFLRKLAGLPAMSWHP